MTTLFGLLFTAIGLFMLVRGLIEFRTGRASRDWPTAEGQVLLATVEVSVSSGDEGTSRRYAPRVVYTYSVRGQEYTSDQIAVGARRKYGSRAKAESKLRYQNGEQIAVCYNPENPAQAVLEPGAIGGAWGTVLIGIVFTVVGGIILFSVVRGM